VKSPLFSVIVASHRRPQLLTRALGSLRTQSCQDFEIILCTDEGSSETKTVAAQCLRETDVFVCRPGARGPAESRNSGLQVARGMYVVFLDDDDTFDPGHLARLAERLQAGVVDVLYTNHTRVQEQRAHDGILIKEERLVSNRGTPIRWLWVVNFITSNAIVINSALARSVSFDTRLQSHEDWDYLLALLSLTDFEHLDCFGPRVHIAEDNSQHRNLTSLRDGSLPLDYLSIYRKWPAPDDEVKARRVAELKKFGMHIPQQFM
jgi:glycosyltransferase involved in cell wall biosynthesis